MGLCEVIGKEEKVKLKKSKIGLFGGLFMSGLAILLNIGLFFIGGGPPLIIILLCMCGIWGYFGIMGVYMLYCYYKLGQGLRADVKRYGEEYLNAHIKQSMLKKYSNCISITPLYFTDRFVIASGNAVFEYSSIVRMYKEKDISGKVAASCMVFENNDGTSLVSCHGITDAEITEIIQLCLSYNPNIVTERG